MKKYVYDPYTPKKQTYAKKVECAYPGCQCDAIRSHLLQKNRWLKDIAENGKVLQMSDDQMQSLLDGDENGNVYSIMSIDKALSLPIYCALHDRKLFKEFEVRELNLENEIHFLKLTYRALCSELAQEIRRRIFYDINPIINPDFQGWLFDEQKAYSNFVIKEFEKYRNDLYAHMKAKDVSDFVFRVIRVPRTPICLSDVLVSDTELWNAYQSKTSQSPIFPTFVHALPYDDESVLIIGYDKRFCNEKIMSDIEKWISCEDKGMVIEDLMVRLNNWCVAPSFFGDMVEDKCEEIMEKKTKYTFGVGEYACNE